MAVRDSFPGRPCSNDRILCTGAYAVPCRADCVLKVDSKDNVSFFGSLPAGGCKWYGGIYSPRNDSMYCIPFSASKVLKVSLENDDCVEIGPDLGTNLAKWHGGILAPDGWTIYGFPAHAQSVLMISVDTDEVALVGDLYEEHNGGRYKVRTNLESHYLSTSNSTAAGASLTARCTASRATRRAFSKLWAVK